MAQFLKRHVQDAIERAALAEFADRGLARATIADIARAAGVSTGNIYRYYENKDALFAAVVSQEFVSQFRTLIRQRVLAYRQGTIRAPTDEYVAVASELLDFCIEHRLRIVTLLLNSDDSPHAGFADLLVGDLVRLADSRFQKVVGVEAPTELRDQLRMLYRVYVRGLAEILAKFESESKIRRYAKRYAVYHISGLEALFQSAQDN